MAQKGSKTSEEVKKKISIAKKGFKHSEEAKRKMSISQTGRKHSKETRKKMSLWQIGRKLSEETKQKISKTEKGKKVFFSEEHRKKLSEAGKKRVFSKEHREKISISKKGEKSNFWIDGRTPENQKIRHSIEYRLWREAVFARDNWTCQKYGIKKERLNVHHIKNFAQYPELRFAIDNGITLSKKAHEEFHKKYGQKDNTKEQLEEFLKY